MSGPFRDEPPVPYLPGRPMPFTPAELDGADGLLPDDVRPDVRIARDLERIATRPALAPSAGFADRVMTAIAHEPGPAPVRAAGAAIRHRAAHALLAAIGDSFRVVVGHGFPVMIRAQALALVLLVAGLTAGTGMATAGAVGWLRDGGAGLVPVTSPSPPASNGPRGVTDPGPSTIGTAEPGDSADQGQGSPEASEPADTTEPSTGADGSHDGEGYGPEGESSAGGGAAPDGPRGPGSPGQGETEHPG